MHNYLHYFIKIFIIFIIFIIFGLSKKIWIKRLKGSSNPNIVSVENIERESKDKDIHKINKTFFQTFYTKYITYPTYLSIKKTLNKNKTFGYKLITDTEAINLIKNNFNKNILKAYLRLNIGAAKGDFIRYIIMYLYGGIYYDLDSSINSSICNIINRNKDNILFVDKNYNFEQWILISKPKNIIYLEVIKEMTERINNNIDNIFLATGPTLFSDVIFYLITKKKIFDTNKKLTRNERKKILKNYSFSHLDLDIEIIFPNNEKYRENFTFKSSKIYYETERYKPTWNCPTPNLYK